MLRGRVGCEKFLKFNTLAMLGLLSYENGQRAEALRPFMV
jgi:hypothetical protein